MSQVNQQYLKDKDGNIFSPIVSGESIKLLRGGATPNVITLPANNNSYDEWLKFSEVRITNTDSDKSVFLLVEGDLSSPEYGLYYLTANGRVSPNCLIHEIVPHYNSTFNSGSYFRVGYTTDNNKATFYIHKAVDPGTKHNYITIQLICLLKDSNDPGTKLYTTTEPTGIKYFNWKIIAGSGLKTS